MKNLCSKTNSGSVLVGSLIFAMAIATCLVSYLWLVQNSDQTVARSQQWNAALAVAEAGVEEGMAILNQQGISTTSNSVTFNPLSRPNVLNNGTASYSVNDASAGVTNIIISAGSVKAPITGDTITRTVRVTAQRQGLFTKGIVSLTDITLKGNGTSFAVDSYDSRIGPYNPNNPIGTNGDVAASGNVDTGNQTINGDLWLSPSGTLTTGPNGGVTGNIYHDWNMTFAHVDSLPAPDIKGWQATPNAAHNFTNSGYYIINDNNDISVAAGITVVLDVKTVNYNMSKTTIAINGGLGNSGTLIIYQENGTVTLGGSSSGGAINGRPQNFQYFGMTGVTAISMGGGSVFVGVIYAPDASLDLSGGGPSNNLMGSFIVKSLSMNGHYNIHYDTSLAGYYFGYYVPGSWQEL